MNSVGIFSMFWPLAATPRRKLESESRSFSWSGIFFVFFIFYVIRDCVWTNLVEVLSLLLCPLSLFCLTEN